MATIQWRPDINTLTVPQSYRVRFVPRNTANIQDIAADIARQYPNVSTTDILNILRAEDEVIMARLLDGEQVDKGECCSWSLSFSGRLDSPDDMLPSLDDNLNVKIQVAQPFLDTIRRGALLERLPMNEKLPMISQVEETLLKLPNVLAASGVVMINGANLLFDPEGGSGGCVIEGTRSGSIIQTRFPVISNNSIMLMPEIPEQDNPWNNEYRISVSTHYSEHGTLCSSIYDRFLRTPLTVHDLGQADPPETGILTGSADTPYVSVIGGGLTDNETLRIQAVHDTQRDMLLFSLLNMHEGDRIGGFVVVGVNGEYTLPGFTNSAVRSLDIRVDDFAALKAMIRHDYNGRLVDVLQVRM